MKPFNLERALAGDPVVTRDGREVLELYHFKHIKERNGYESIYALIENRDEPNVYFARGNYKDDDDASNYDLFMKSISKTYWMNVYKTPGGYQSGNIHPSEQEALNLASNDRSVIKTISFEIEE